MRNTRLIFDRVDSVEEFIETMRAEDAEDVPYTLKRTYHQIEYVIRFSKFTAEQRKVIEYSPERLRNPWKYHFWKTPVFPLVPLLVSTRLPEPTVQDFHYAYTSELHSAADLVIPLNLVREEGPFASVSSSASKWPAYKPWRTELPVDQIPPLGCPDVERMMIPLSEYKTRRLDNTSVFYRLPFGVTEVEMPRLCLSDAEEMMRVIREETTKNATLWGGMVPALNALRECLFDDKADSETKLLIGVTFDFIYTLVSRFRHQHCKIQAIQLPSVSTPFFPSHKPLPPMAAAQLDIIRCRLLIVHQRNFDHLFHKITSADDGRGEYRRADYSILFATVCSFAFVFSMVIEDAAMVGQMTGDCQTFQGVHDQMESAMETMIGRFVQWMGKVREGEDGDEAGMIYRGVKKLREMVEYGGWWELGGPVVARWLRCIYPMEPVGYRAEAMTISGVRDYLNDWDERHGGRPLVRNRFD